MTSSINTNIAAYYAQGNINSASNQSAESVARLSSGNRIVEASDDVAALAVGTSLGTQVSALKAAQSNAAQGTSLLQVADGALAQIESILQQQQSIAQQALSGSLTDTDRGFLDQEFQALTAEINQIANGTSFNGVNLLAGGTGTTTTLDGTDALAAAFTPGTVTGQTAPGTVPATGATSIEAFFSTTGAIANTAATQKMLYVSDASGTLLANGAYNSVNSTLSGGLSNFTYSNVTYGAAAAGNATLSVTIGGQVYSGQVTGAATSAILSNGTTNIDIGLVAADDTFTNAGVAQFSQATLAGDFVNTVIQRTQVVQGVSFAGTGMTGVTGAVGTGIASVRLNSGNAVISNFQYAGNNGANKNILTVQINGETFTATAVNDSLTSAAGTVAFVSSDNQVLYLNLTGLTTSLTNIRTSATDQSNLINSLNQAFSHAGSGLNFNVGTTATSNINVSLGSATSSSIFGGQTLSVASAASATAANTALTSALNTVTSLRSTVGALESQFGFASANLQSSVQNESAAQSSLLDTDVASESTNYATEQVKLQAGISVLAQANQQLQALLKLIG